MANEQLEAASIPDIDPKYKALLLSQQQNANNFRINKGQLVQDQMQLPTESSLRGISTQLAQNRKDYGGRGLLYSGLRDVAGAKAQGQAAGDLSGQRYNTNQAIEGQQQQMDQGVIKNGMQMRDLEQDRKNKLYQDALARYKGNVQADSGLGFLSRPINSLTGEQVSY